MVHTLNFSAETIFLFARKKHIGLLMLVVLAVLPVLLMVGLQTTQQWLRHSRNGRYDAIQMVTVAVDAATVVWEEPGRELRIGERFFDVASQQQQGSLLLLYGHYDDPETAVWHLLQSAWQYGSKTGYHLLLLLQCCVPLVLLAFAFTCIRLVPSWQLPGEARWLQHTALPPFNPPRWVAQPPL